MYSFIFAHSILQSLMIYSQVKFLVSWEILSRSSLTIRSTAIVFIFLKTRVNDDSNGMHNITLDIDH